MRRHRSGGRLQPDELVALYAKARAESMAMTARGRAAYVRTALAEAGADPLDAFLARYWIRIGRPDDYGPARRRGWTRA